MAKLLCRFGTRQARQQNIFTQFTTTLANALSRVETNALLTGQPRELDL